MNTTQIIALLFTLTAAFSYINHHTLKLPTTIGVMAFAMLASLILTALDFFGLESRLVATQLVNQIRFDKTLLEGLLGPLLFAGALFVNLDDLLKQKWTILIFASVGVLLSMLIVAWLTSFIAGLLGLQLPWIYCLIFGALISPTDPIAVLGILRKLGVSKTLETKFTGESLFNDGIGVVVFIVLLEIAAGGDADAVHVATLFGWEVGGGLLLGLVLGSLVYFLIRTVDNFQIEILLSLALITGGYALASQLHISGPIFAVIAGLLIGNVGRKFAMSEHTRQHLDTFWELVDEILNAVLFLLIGLEVLVASWSVNLLWLGLASVLIVLLARFISLGILVNILKRGREFSPHVIKVLTWGGLRGGISVALALSLPPGPEREILVGITFVVVAFSILVSGLSLGSLVNHYGLAKKT
ncbi:MAG: CPA1 family monovalent cation:H+ antiporter [Parasphingorhabdus sp.]|jgi:CPA1 family monovalent cation:H+ antiporter